ncbi:MAG: hypothetical protein JSR48_13535 [Verrucomicrobia bacterium]|nr:hypothetical protein [Verrucomicrobiota bacterium]
MKTTPLTSKLPAVAAVGPAMELPSLWLCTITARREPQLLARLLSKLANPDVEVFAVEYRVIEESPERVRCNLCVHATAAWAEFVMKKLRQVVAVEEVSSIRCVGGR